MRHLLLGLALTLAAVPAVAEFDYTSIKEIKRAGLPAQVAEAKRLKTLLELFFASADGDELKETVDVVFLWDRTVKDLARDLPYLEGVKKTGRLVVAESEVLPRFEQTAAHLFSVLAAIAKVDPADPDLKALAEWGHNRYYQYDPVLPGHSQRLFDKGKLNLK